MTSGKCDFWTNLLTKATIPFDLIPTTSTLPGVQQHQYENAVKILDELRIIDPKFRQIILTSPAHVMGTNRYRHGMKLGTIKANTNAGGLLLVTLGLVPPKAPKPA